MRKGKIWQLGGYRLFQCGGELELIKNGHERLKGGVSGSLHCITNNHKILMAFLILISISFFLSTCRPAAVLLEVVNCGPVLFHVSYPEARLRCPTPWGMFFWQ